MHVCFSGFFAIVSFVQLAVGSVALLQSAVYVCHRKPQLLSRHFFNTCIKCFGKKDEINEIKNYYKKVLWVCAYLSSLKKIHFCMGLPHTKVGFKTLFHVAPILYVGKVIGFRLFQATGLLYIICW